MSAPFRFLAGLLGGRGDEDLQSVNFDPGSARLMPQVREQYKDPQLWPHLETVGNEFAAYFKHRSPEAYEAFLKRIKG